MQSKSRRSFLKYFVTSFVGILSGCTSVNQKSTPPTSDKTKRSETLFPENITRYRDLDEKSKKVFTDALESGETTVQPDVPTDLRENQYVIYKEDKFRIKYQAGSNIAEFSLSTQKIPEEDAKKLDKIQNFSELSENAKIVFKKVVDGGTYKARESDFPDELQEDSKAIKYNNVYYKLNLTVFDRRVWIVEVERIG